MIAKEAEGFIYIVSSLGVTGVRSEIKTDLDSIVKVIRENTDVPCAIGFGISTPEQAKKIGRYLGWSHCRLRDYQAFGKAWKRGAGLHR